MVSARRDAELGRRLCVEVAAAVILHGRIAAIVVSAHGENYDLRIQAVGERALIGAIEGLFTFQQLPVKLRSPRLGVGRVLRQAGNVVLQVYGSPQFSQKVD